MAAALPVAAFEIEDRAMFGPADADTVLRVISTADIEFFLPMIDAYLATDANVAVDYTVASSSELMRALDGEEQAFDLAISSAMDLQTNLANDGHVQKHFPDLPQALPGWAVWNDMLFAFTQEPAAIVISDAAFTGLTVPTNRQELITVMRENPDLFRSRIGTYDVRRSGLGYLFATQDSRISETYWRLTEVMGGLDVQLYCCSSDMLNDVQTGRLAVAYNVLGSYASERPERDGVSILLPTDFTTVMLRTVLIPSLADHPQEAGEFIDFMLRQTYVSQTSPLLQSGPIETADPNALHRIRLGPGLLVYLDQFKNRSFLSEWENAILQR